MPRGETGTPFLSATRKGNATSFQNAFRKGQAAGIKLLMQQKRDLTAINPVVQWWGFARRCIRQSGCVSKESAVAPAKGRGKRTPASKIDGQKPLCHAAFQTRKQQRAYCNTKTAENGFLIFHAYQERK